MHQSCSREISLSECERTCEALSCLLYRSVASEQPIFIGAGNPVSDGYRSRLFQDVPDQSRHMLTSKAHVQTFLLSCRSQRRTTTRRSSAFHTLPLETEYSSFTSSTTGYCMSGNMWPLHRRRSAIYYMETLGVVGSVFSSQKNRELKLKYFRKFLETTFCLQEVHLKDEYLQAIQVLAPRFRLFWYLHSWQRKCREIGKMHSQGHSSRRGCCDTFDCFSRP